MLNFPSLYQQPIKGYEPIHSMLEVEEILSTFYSRDDIHSAHTGITLLQGRLQTY